MFQNTGRPPFLQEKPGSCKDIAPIACGAVLAIVSAILFELLFARLTAPETPTIPRKNAPQRLTTGPPRRIRALQQNTLSDFQETDFYRTIVDNNLFRPLGWTPPRPREPYRLLGTLIPRAANTPKQAILKGNASQQTHTVTIGDKLDENTTVTDIQSKQVTLKTNEQQRTLILNTTPFLK